MNGHITGGASVDVNANATNDAEAHTLAGSISLGGAPRRLRLVRRNHEQGARDGERRPGRLDQRRRPARRRSSRSRSNTAKSTAEVGSSELVFGAAVSVPTASDRRADERDVGRLRHRRDGLHRSRRRRTTTRPSRRRRSAPACSRSRSPSPTERSRRTPRRPQASAQHAVISASGSAVSVKAKENDTVDATTGDPEITISIAFSLGIIDAKGHDYGGSHASFDGELTDASSLTVRTDATRSVTVTSPQPLVLGRSRGSRARTRPPRSATTRRPSTRRSSARTRTSTAPARRSRSPRTAARARARSPTAAPAPSSAAASTCRRLRRSRARCSPTSTAAPRSAPTPASPAGSG